MNGFNQQVFRSENPGFANQFNRPAPKSLLFIRGNVEAAGHCRRCEAPSLSVGCQGSPVELRGPQYDYKCAVR